MTVKARTYIEDSFERSRHVSRSTVLKGGTGMTQLYLIYSSFTPYQMTREDS
jgi:hypothetical protein